jgi:predicted MFS family arabinose efflux permease
MILAMALRDSIGWRGVFYITGTMGVLLAIVIWFGVREAPRGKSEPELAHLEEIGIYRFDKKIALGLFRKRSLLLLFAQGFFGVFPWNVIAYWFFRYLETERHYSSDAVLMTMGVAVVVLAAGYFVGGAMGDFAFKLTPRGRPLVCTAAVLLGAVFMFITLSVPADNQMLFLVLLGLTALFVPVASPNVVSTVYDITLPEVRSTALAVQYLIEESGAALAPLLAGLIATSSSLHNAILIICVSAWVLCSIFFAVTAYLVPRDIDTLRGQMRQRAERETSNLAPSLRSGQALSEAEGVKRD